MLVSKTDRPGFYQEIHKFDNGYGASIVKHGFSYGGNSGFYEIGFALFDGDDWQLHDNIFSNGADQVKGWLTMNQCLQFLALIASFEPGKCHIIHINEED